MKTSEFLRKAAIGAFVGTAAGAAIVTIDPNAVKTLQDVADFAVNKHETVYVMGLETQPNGMQQIKACRDLPCNAGNAVYIDNFGPQLLGPK